MTFIVVRRIIRRLLSTSSVPLPPGPKPEPPLQRVTTAINRISKEWDPDKLAADFIAASSASYRFRCRHRIYEMTVRRLAAAGRLDAVEAVLEAQKRFTSELRLSEGFSVRIISLYGKVGMPSHAAATFAALPSIGAPRSVKCFNALLTAYVEAGDAEGMAAVFRDVPAADPSIVPDVISYNILVRGLCERGDLDRAFDTVELMEMNGVAPDRFTFNTILNWCYEKKKVPDAEKAWALMKKKGIEPDLKSYNTKLRWLASEGRTSEAAELVDLLRSVEPAPDTFSWNALIRGHLREGNLEAAKKVFAELPKNGCVPNWETFELLIPGLCEAGELDMAAKCCYDGFSRRCFVDAAILQRVVDGLVKVSRMEEAKKLVELGRKNNYSRKSLRISSTNQIKIVE